MRAYPQPDEQGSAMIEFAISVIVLAVLVFGCVGVAMAFYTYEVVNQYARDASRYAITHGNGCVMQSAGNVGTSCSIGTGGDATAPASVALKAYLNHQIYPGINGANLTVSTTYTHAPGITPAPGTTGCFATNCNGGGDQVTVTVTYPYLYNLPFIPQRAFTMHGTSTMIISQ